ncbi:MAG: hypothetical protein R3242_11995 [Akkermansiaceae bacterium]|nr:hypothetical protein [Akkermansiaceae bacterium]
MYRLLLLLSLLPIILCLLLTWWFGSRVLWAEGKRQCRCNLEKWYPDPEDERRVHRSDGSSSEFGQQLRKKALADWKEHSPKLVKTRESKRAIGMIMPPFGGIIGVFLAVTGKPILALAAFVGATAISAIIGLLSLPSELTAIRRYIQSKAFKGSFPNSYDEESVINCALAHAWAESLPPILKWFQSGKG